MKYKFYLNLHNPLEKLSKIMVCCEDMKRLFLCPWAVQNWGIKGRRSYQQVLFDLKV